MHAEAPRWAAADHIMSGFGRQIRFLSRKLLVDGNGVIYPFTAKGKQLDVQRAQPNTILRLQRRRNVYKYSVNIGKRVGSEYEYLINFYTDQLGATLAVPPPLQGSATGLSTFSQVLAHGWVYALIPAAAPNAMMVMHNIITVERKQPILALNIHLQEYGDDGRYLGNRSSVFLHDVSFIDFAPANERGYVEEPGGGFRDDDDIIAEFKGTIGPIQTISGSIGV
jgi:hypothetical protein